MTTNESNQAGASSRPRLDDLFRYAVHRNPNILHGIVAPDLYLLRTIESLDELRAAIMQRLNKNP